MPGPRGRRGPGSRGVKSTVKNPGKILGRLLKYVTGTYLLQCILVLIFIIVSVLANVQGTLFMKTLIDDYIQPMLTQASPDFLPLAMAIGRVAVFLSLIHIFIAVQCLMKLIKNEKISERKILLQPEIVARESG